MKLAGSVGAQPRRRYGEHAGDEVAYEPSGNDRIRGPRGRSRPIPASTVSAAAVADQAVADAHADGEK